MQPSESNCVGSRVSGMEQGKNVSVQFCKRITFPEVGAYLWLKSWWKLSNGRLHWASMLTIMLSELTEWTGNSPTEAQPSGVQLRRIAQPEENPKG